MLYLYLGKFNLYSLNSADHIGNKSKNIPSLKSFMSCEMISSLYLSNYQTNLATCLGKCLRTSRNRNVPVDPLLFVMLLICLLTNDVSCVSNVANCVIYQLIFPLSTLPEQDQSFSIEKC